MLEGARTTGTTAGKTTGNVTTETGPEAGPEAGPALGPEAGPGTASASAGLARSSLLMAAGTVVSRATGLIRTVLQAAALGTGLLATTYNTANTVPTSLYTLLIGGALNAVLVPQLVRARATHPDGGRAYEQRLVTLVLTVLGVGTALAVWGRRRSSACTSGTHPTPTSRSN